MNYADYIETTRAAQLWMADNLGRMEPEYAAEAEAQRCPQCRAQLGAHDVVYTTKRGWCEIGCWDCCHIDDAGDLILDSTGEVLEYAGHFMVKECFA